MEVIVDGKRVEVGTGGREPTGGTQVVLLHGAGMDHTVWQFQARALAAHGFDVYAVDLPGHGRSEGPAPASIADYAAWVVRFLDAAGIDRAVLVGHSMGSLIALEVAGTHPERVAGLVLLGVAARMPVHPDLLAAAKANDHLAYDLVASWSHTKASHAGHHPTPGLWMMGATVRLLERSAPGVLSNDLAACDAYEDAVNRAQAVTAPTLLLLAAEDLMTRPKGAAPLAEHLPDAVVQTVPRAGHMAMVEDPDAVIDAIVDFVDTAVAAATESA